MEEKLRFHIQQNHQGSKNFIPFLYYPHPRQLQSVLINTVLKYSTLYYSTVFYVQ